MLTCNVLFNRNHYEPCVLYIGRAHRYPLNTPVYIFFQQIFILNFFKHAAHETWALLPI
jgi:hypothetical protein